jgi:hypothetical protein
LPASSPFREPLCEKCRHRLGYLPLAATLSAVELDGDVWKALAAPGTPFRFCANAQHDVCNWLIEAPSADAFCLSCRHNRTIPALSVEANVDGWRKIGRAKNRLFYSLLRLELPLVTKPENEQTRLAFDVLADLPQSGAPPVMTGHDNGLITIALAEADDLRREQSRVSMHEPYRTLLGHFRHEVGHYFWDRLVRDGGRVEPFRALFGDEQADYSQALQRHYKQGAPADWQARFVSAYATMHPWEDFAEHTTCTSSIHARRPTPSACRPGRPSLRVTSSTPRWTSTLPGAVRPRPRARSRSTMRLPTVADPDDARLARTVAVAFLSAAAIVALYFGRDVLIRRQSTFCWRSCSIPS